MLTHMLKRFALALNVPAPRVRLVLPNVVALKVKRPEPAKEPRPQYGARFLG